MMLAALAALAALGACPDFVGERRRNAGVPDRIGAGSDPPLELGVRLAFAGTLMIVLLWAACGGGAGGFRNPGTPPGTYQLTIGGISTSGSASLQHQTTLTLTVN